jgi:hypothetical protein
VGVIALHGLTANELHDSWSAFHVGQAVPVFMVLMAMNAASSFYRAHGERPALRDLLSRAYLARRLERLGAPFAVVWLASLAIGAVRGGLDFGPTTLVGVTPLTGPGNYFVSITLEFVLVAPILFWAFRRRPLLTIAACFAVDAAFELVAPHVFEGAYPYEYDAAILRYGGQIALGFWIASQLRAGGVGRRWIPVLALVPISVAYLVAVHEDPGAFDWLRLDFGTTTNFIAAPYAAAIVLAGLRWLPRREDALPVRVLAEVGRASWHVFLVQMIWFTLVDSRGLDAFALNLLGAVSIGYALYRLMALPPIATRIGNGTAWLARS